MSVHSKEKHPQSKFKQVMHELKHHLPFTSAATLVAVLGVWIFFSFFSNVKIDESLFEGFHFGHIVLASIVSAAMFYRYKNNFLVAIFVGIFASVLFGSVSDVVFPYIGAWIFNLQPEFHLPLIEEPLIILGLGLFGAVLGIILKITTIPHFLHVGVSVLASLLYLTSYVKEAGISFFVVSFFVVVISVVIPCCIGDIILPFFFLGERIKHCSCSEEECEE